MGGPKRSDDISIHSSHTGRDYSASTPFFFSANFNPLFPYGKRHQLQRPQWPCYAMSIHSSHTGRDCNSVGPPPRHDISIHSSHTGRDDVLVLGNFFRNDFNPLFPYGKRLVLADHPAFPRVISIHSSHTGRDPPRPAARPEQRAFQSTLPIREETEPGKPRSALR